jgi:putative phosphoesterase
MLRIGLISDTHGLLRPEALAWLAGSDHIVHGGDIGGAEILEALARIAPLSVVRGNNDTAPWARELPESLTLTFGAVRVHVLHNLAELDAAASATVVVSGHSHRPRIERRDGVWYVNPGSAGPRRFKLPISVGELRIDGGTVEPRLMTLGSGIASR